MATTAAPPGLLCGGRRAMPSSLHLPPEAKRRAASRTEALPSRRSAAPSFSASAATRATVGQADALSRRTDALLSARGERDVLRPRGRTDVYARALALRAG